jgi:hypothetical protein
MTKILRRIKRHRRTAGRRAAGSAVIAAVA